MNRPGSEVNHLDAAPLGHEYSEAPLFSSARPHWVEGHNLRHVLPDSRDLHSVLPVMLSQVMISQPRAATCGI